MASESKHSKHQIAVGRQRISEQEPNIRISQKEKGGKTYLRVLKNEWPVVRVIIDWATGDVEAWHLPEP